MRRTYLLDTNIISELVHRPHGVIAERILRVGQDHVFTSVIVACELRYGIAKKNSAKLTGLVEAALDALTIKPFDGAVDAEYAAIRVALERKGTPIGGNDLLIAAHARALGAVCVTDNEAEFRRVPGLTVENWL